MPEKTSIVGTVNKDGTHSFKCLQKDVSKLPTLGIETGSTCYVIDTGDVLMFEKTTEQWFAQ